MKILLIGASGLLGEHFFRALHNAGHAVSGTKHGATNHDIAMQPSALSINGTRAIAVDFRNDITTEIWLPRLRDIDIVINAVGIIRERGAESFQRIHYETPRALFLACVAAGVRRVIQISALGADENARTDFHRSKKQADDFLLALPIKAVVVQPSLVFAEGGASTKLFAALAAMPLIALPGSGEQRIQPVHIDDLSAAIVKLVDVEAAPARIAAVGGQALNLRDYLQKLRDQLGYGPAFFLSIPLSVVRIFLRLPGVGKIINSDNVSMLQRGNYADAKLFAQLLGHAPRSPRNFLTAASASSLRRHGALQIYLPLLRFSIALLWIGTGIVSLGIYPVDESLLLLQRTGLTGDVAKIALYGAALIDIGLGIATLWWRTRCIWTVQIGLILIYTIIISIRLPEFWLHPYAPILKNIPLLAAIVLLRGLERR